MADQSTTPMADSLSVTAAAKAWPPTLRIAFRFICVYLLLFGLPGFLGYLPFPDGSKAPWRALVSVMGRLVLGPSRVIVAKQTGSGDTLFQWVELLTVLVLSLLVTLAWSFVDRRRKEYALGHESLRIYIRYLVGTHMMLYGTGKLFVLQFRPPAPERLLETVGDMSPMGLLWTFMGYSPVYTAFTGAVEILGAVLLFFRRTTLAGALVVIAAMSNVVMLNLCYDVPVKIFSFHLLLMAGVLLLPDGARIADFLFRNRPTAPLPPPPPFPRWLAKAGRIAKPLYIGLILIGPTAMDAWALFQYGLLAPRPALLGAYEVEQFMRDGQIVPPSLSETTRWRALGMGSLHRLTIVRMDNERQRFTLRHGAEKKTLTLTALDDADKASGPAMELTYAMPDPAHLVLTGRFEGAAIEVRLRRRDEASFLLPRRGFHWVNEIPYNR